MTVSTNANDKEIQITIMENDGYVYFQLTLGNLRLTNRGIRSTKYSTHYDSAFFTITL